MPSPSSSSVLIHYDNVITTSNAIPILNIDKSSSQNRCEEEDIELIASSYNPKRTTSLSTICRFQNLGSSSNPNTTSQSRAPFQSPYSISRSETRSLMNQKSPPPYLVPFPSHGKGIHHHHHHHHHHHKDLVHYQELVPKNTTSISSLVQHHISPSKKDNNLHVIPSHSLSSSSSSLLPPSSELWSLEGFEDRLVLLDDEPTEDDDTVHDNPPPTWSSSIDQETVFDMDM